MHRLGLVLSLTVPLALVGTQSALGSTFSLQNLGAYIESVVLVEPRPHDDDGTAEGGPFIVDTVGSYALGTQDGQQTRVEVSDTLTVAGRGEGETFAFVDVDTGKMGVFSSATSFVETAADPDGNVVENYMNASTYVQVILELLYSGPTLTLSDGWVTHQVEGDFGPYDDEALPEYLGSLGAYVIPADAEDEDDFTLNLLSMFTADPTGPGGTPPGLTDAEVTDSFFRASFAAPAVTLNDGDRIDLVFGFGTGVGATGTGSGTANGLNTGTFGLSLPEFAVLDAETVFGSTPVTWVTGATAGRDGPDPTAPIPLPAAGWLLLGALGTLGLGAARRRRG